MGHKISIFWFRRDLRLDDNVGFLEALKGDFPVMPIFIFDKNILDKLPRNDARVTFIHDRLQRMRSKIQENQESSIALYLGTPEEIFSKLIDTYEIAQVYTNHDYEPYARERDKKIGKLLADKGVEFLTFKDQVVFEKSEVVKDDGDPYVVYTPYRKQWKEKFSADKNLEIHYTSQYLDNLIGHSRLPNLSLADLRLKGRQLKFRIIPLPPPSSRITKKPATFPQRKMAHQD